MSAVRSRGSDSIAKELISLDLMASLHLLLQRTPQIDGTTQLAKLLVAFRPHDSMRQRFKLSDVLIRSGDVHAEAIPRASVTIFQVLTKSVAKAACKTDVVELAIPVEGVDSVTPMHMLNQLIQVALDCLARDVLQVILNQKTGASRHL